MKSFYKIAGVISMLLVFGFAFAQEEAETQWTDFDGGKYSIGTGDNENIMVILPNKPLMTERLAKYGNLIADPRTRERSFNVKDDSKVVPKALEMYDLLTRLQTRDGWFAFSVVILEYDRVTIVKYSRTDWNEVLDLILNAFK